jgi:hypothetical protein
MAGEDTVFIVTVNYKSGNKETFRAKSIAYAFSPGGGRKLEWEGIDGEYRPLLIGVDDIESVWYAPVKAGSYHPGAGGRE